MLAYELAACRHAHQASAAGFQLTKMHVVPEASLQRLHPKVRWCKNKITKLNVLRVQRARASGVWIFPSRLRGPVHAALAGHSVVSQLQKLDARACMLNSRPLLKLNTRTAWPKPDTKH